MHNINYLYRVILLSRLGYTIEILGKAERGGLRPERGELKGMRPET